jgi:hypothetical protein
VTPDFQNVFPEAYARADCPHADRLEQAPFHCVRRVAPDAESASAVSEIELDCFSASRGLVKGTRLYFGTRPNIGFIGAIASSLRLSLISVERAQTPRRFASLLND